MDSGVSTIPDAGNPHFQSNSNASLLLNQRPEDKDCARAKKIFDERHGRDNTPTRPQNNGVSGFDGQMLETTSSSACQGAGVIHFAGSHRLGLPGLRSSEKHHLESQELGSPEQHRLQSSDLESPIRLSRLKH